MAAAQLNGCEPGGGSVHGFGGGEGPREVGKEMGTCSGWGQRGGIVASEVLGEDRAPVVFSAGLDLPRAMGSMGTFSGWGAARWVLPQGKPDLAWAGSCPSPLGPNSREMLLLALGFSNRCLKPG